MSLIFDLDLYREANNIEIQISKDDFATATTIFTADTINNPEIDATLNFKSFGEVLERLGDLGPFTRSTINSIASSTGVEIGGTLDVPIKPYIQKSSHISQTVKCILPIKSDPNVDIYKPLANLYCIVLPRTGLQQETDSIVAKLKTWVDDTFEGEESGFWLALKDTLQGYIKDFLKGVYLLRDPVQFNRSIRMAMRWGNVTFLDTFITGIKVSYGKNLYTSTNSNNDILWGDRRIYPTHVMVDISFTTKNATRVDTIFTADKAKSLADSTVSDFLNDY